ncbi:MAG: FGGY-family carbohydrate kinase, partial [Acidimicrobiaceae bacterium]|nr:FGGY-family carbohydrate kinase [Acidimicrobiaceae bacterium]
GSILRADGGMTSSDYTMQSVANILGVTVEVPKIAETTSLGVAYLAGLGSGLCNSLEEIEVKWEINKRFTSEIDDSTRAKKLANWKDAVNRTLSHPT